jgi:hypothetical protein
MNRRTSLKSALGLSLLGISSFSAYKWYSLNKEIDIKSIISFKPLISELAETIIPQTDTPGAKAAGVENFIVNVITNCTGKKEQNKFLAGLNDLEEYTMDTYNKTFFKCTAQEKTQILEHFENKDTYRIGILNKINNKFLGQSFFTKLKSLTIEGYCSSQKGATEGLAYDYIPVNYDACIPLKPNQKSWATK